MKKIISYVLLLAMAVALFAGCAPKADNSGLESAKEYLYAMYKDTNGTVTNVNYSRVGMVTIQGVGAFTVEWTSSNDAVKVTPNDKMVDITIPEYPESEIAYTLTATIKDDKGNSTSVSFNYTIPAAEGQPATLADGTYVITAGSITMSSLTEDKGYGYPTGNTVTIADGKVTGHAKADVLTIKNVEGGVTIQDAYGRYFYLKGTYNSFNVDAAAPSEGHVWEVLKNGDTYLIVNAMNKKTLAYSASYSSWGAYPELTDDHNSALVIVAATAPAEDPDQGGNNGGENNNTETPAPEGMIETPVAGTAYTMMITQGNKNANLYFTGTEKENYPWYIMSTQNEAESVQVYLEEVTGGYRLYFMKGSDKTYLDMYKDDTHYSLRLTKEPTAVYTWNAEHKTLVATVEDKDCFIGTSGTYDTFSCNKMEKIDSSFPAHFYGEGGSNTETPEEPTEAPTEAPTEGEKPSQGTDVTLTNGMKVVIYAPSHKKALSSKPASEGSFYQMGVDITISGSTVTGFSDTEVWTVVVNSDGSVSFEQGGKKLAMQDSYSSMSLGAVNDKWEVISLGNGLYNIKNTVRGNMIEWYDSKGNWSTYTSDKAATDPLFQMSFFIVG